MSFSKTFLLLLFILCLDRRHACGGSEASFLDSVHSFPRVLDESLMVAKPLLTGPTTFILFEFIVRFCCYLGFYFLGQSSVQSVKFKTQHFPENVNFLLVSPF